MTPEEIKKYYRTNYNFEKETGISANTLANWLKWARVPKESQYKLERITNGLFKTEWTQNDNN